MAQSDKTIAGIILDLQQRSEKAQSAALNRIDNVSFLGSIAVCMRESDCAPIMIVTTDENPIKAESERLGVIPIGDNSGAKGEIPDLKKALGNIRREMLGALITPVTYPQVTKNVYLLICHVFMENPDRIIIPIYKGRRGYPVALPNSVLDDIRRDASILYLDDLLRAHSGLIFEQLVNDPGIIRQVRFGDDPSDS
jgi:CTP:molybdopterin cytidylyltransferase MocA